MYDEFVVDNAKRIDGVRNALFSIEKALIQVLRQIVLRLIFLEQN